MLLEIKNKKRLLNIFCIIVLSILISYLMIYLVIPKLNNQGRRDEQKKINSFFGMSKKDLEQKQYLENNIVEVQNEQVNTVENYIAVIEIPKINLKKVIYDKKSKYNNLDKNIQILEKSKMFGEIGNTILVAHSGSSKISFFRNLHKLKENDYIYVYYKNIKYTYTVNQIILEKKTGYISLFELEEENCLILSTCGEENQTQLVVLCNIIKKEEY